jgi:formate dehydrogenase subunit delta
MDIAHLHMMANQIARNLAAQGDAAAIAGTEQHIRSFWDPRMKAAMLASDYSRLDPLALKAIEQFSQNP